jgi:hypothetical protein
MTMFATCPGPPHETKDARIPRALVFAALIALLGYEITRTIGGFQRIRALIVRRGKAKNLESRGDPVRIVCLAVAKACSLYPRTVKCLQRSSVIVYLLRMYGVKADLVFGVERFPFYAHAWVEVEGRIVNDRKVKAIYQTIGRI